MNVTTLKGKREELELTAALLARVLDVSQATVFRQEAAGDSWLWWYALQGIEAELKESRRSLLRSDHNIQKAEFYWDKGKRATAARVAVLREGRRVKGLDIAGYDDLKRRIVTEFLPKVLAEAERAETANKRAKSKTVPPPNVVKLQPETANNPLVELFKRP